MAAEVALTLFALCNALRVFAYLPQIVAIARDRSGACAVSQTTWGLFAASNLSTMAYAVFALQDWVMAAIFGASAGCCLAIVGLTALKRAQLKRNPGILCYHRGP
jgi:hypothetical protein